MKNEGKTDPIVLTDEVAKELAQNMATLADEFPALREEVKNLKSGFKELKDLDINKTVDRVDELKSRFDALSKAIRMGNGNPARIPGLEEEANKFSMIRVCAAVARGGSKDAFEKMKAGFEFEVMTKARELMLKATQQADVDELGGYFVPDQVLNDVIPAIYAKSVLIDLFGDGTTRVRTLDGLLGGTVHIPKYQDGMVAGWIGEKGAFPKTGSTVEMETLRRKKLGLLTVLTDEMRRFAQFGFEALFREDMIRAAAFEADRAILYGKGSDFEPGGLVTRNINFIHADDLSVIQASATSLATAKAATWNGGEFDFDGLLEMMGALEDQDLAVEDDWWFVWAPIYSRRLKKLKVSNFSGQTAEKPYLLGQPLLRDDQLSALVGNWVASTKVKNKQVPGESIGGQTGVTDEFYGDVFGGNLQNVIFARWSGVEIDTDDGRGDGFKTDLTNIKLRMYADVGVRQEKNLVLCPDAKQRDA